MTASALLKDLHNGAVIANISQRIRKTMESELQIVIDGAKISSCSGGKKTTTTVFDATGDRLAILVEPASTEVRGPPSLHGDDHDHGVAPPAS
jgi:hypothetical protein